ncbi:hypothetical protein [Cellulomonas phragmiteti]|nr:hypothetical protein [Cellulomonas phragmiteti]
MGWDVRGTRRRSVVLGAAVALAVLAGCSWGTPDAARPAATPSATPTPEPLTAAVRTDVAPATVVAGDAPAVALATSVALLAAAPVVVLAPLDDVAASLTAASAAVALGAPVLPTAAGADVATELARLGTTHALVVGDPGTDLQLPGVTLVPVPAGADGAVLARATGHRFGEPTPVAPGQEQAVVATLVGPEPAVLLAAGADAAGGGPDAGTSSPTAGPTGGDATTSTSAEDPTALPPTGPVVATGVLALTDGSPALAATATLRALGVGLLDVPGGDPRSTSTVVQAVAQAAPTAVLAYGETFGTPERLASRVATARTGVELPGGGQLVFPSVPEQPGKKYVALYGTPGSSALGVLGEQDVPSTIVRAEQHAAPYRDLTTDTVVPAVEIIATIASSGAEADGSYSRKRPVEDLRPLVEAAGAAGQYVVLDLQPGRQDFVTQAQLYAELLALPHVGLALDPEWRLAPDQVHLRQIGSVGIDEVNATAAWLAQLTRERGLPQKMLVLHQFSLRMIGERERLDTSHDEIALLIHVDGQGSQPAKAGTWQALRAGAPPVHWGWKNFYDEDVPMLDPAQTYQVQPVPDLVTYQ